MVGGGVKDYQKLRDVIYGLPHTRDGTVRNIVIIFNDFLITLNKYECFIFHTQIYVSLHQTKLSEPNEPKKRVGEWW
jgi:hypothetical protein